MVRFACIPPSLVVYEVVKEESSLSTIVAYDTSTKSVTEHEIDGTVVQLASDNSHCAILSLDENKLPTITVLYQSGHIVDTLVPNPHTKNVQWTPFACGIGTSVICMITSSYFLLWRFESCSPIANVGLKEKIVDIDQSQRMFGPQSITTHQVPNRMSKDPANCLSVVNNRMILGRVSGKVQLYSLPHGFLITVVDDLVNITKHLKGIWLNCDGTFFAFYANKTLGYFNLVDGKVAPKKVQCDIDKLGGVIWASDDTGSLAMLNGNIVYVIEQQLSEWDTVEVGEDTGLAYFSKLELTVVNLNTLPDKNSSNVAKKPGITTSVICLGTLQLVTAMLSAYELIRKGKEIEFDWRRFQNFFQMEDLKDLTKVSERIKKSPHKELWKLLADTALTHFEFTVAEFAYGEARNYFGIRTVKSIEDEPDINIKKAKIAEFLEKFSEAAHYYEKAKRKDLADEMWCFVDTDPDQNTSTIQNESTKELVESCLALECMENGQFQSAAKHHQMSKDTFSAIQSCVIEQDWETLEKVAHGISSDDPNFSSIARILASYGEFDLAIPLFLQGKQFKEATEAALNSDNLKLLHSLTNESHSSEIAPILLGFLKQLVAGRHFLDAVNVLKTTGNQHLAGIVTKQMACKLLKDSPTPDLHLTKGLCVMSGLSMTQPGPKSHLLHSTTYKSDLEGIIPSEFFVSASASEVKEEGEDAVAIHPWRPAIALQLLILTQLYIRSKKFFEATLVALSLRKYIDILGNERVNTLLALSATSCGRLWTASQAFTALGPEYDDLATQMLSNDLDFEYGWEEPQHFLETCQNCKKDVEDTEESCPHCDTQFVRCMASGLLIRNPSLVWRCNVCHQCSETMLSSTFNACPVCYQ